MDKILELLFRQPIILFVLAVWIIGAIANVAKATKKRREQAERERRRRPAEPKQPVTELQPIEERRVFDGPVRGPRVSAPGSAAGGVPAQQAGGSVTGSAAQSPEEIAMEMRRILGLEPKPAAPPPPPRPAAPPPPPPPPPSRTPRRAFETSNPQSHAGQRIRDYHMKKSTVGQPRAGSAALGSLGGRSKVHHRRAEIGSRYALDDLRKVIVMNEILSPPVSLRPFADRRPD